jgi:hypothetical protein
MIYDIIMVTFFYFNISYIWELEFTFVNSANYHI